MMKKDVKTAWAGILLIGGLTWLLFYSIDRNAHFHSHWIPLYKNGLVNEFELACAWGQQAWNLFTSMLCTVTGAVHFIDLARNHFTKKDS